MTSSVAPGRGELRRFHGGISPRSMGIMEIHHVPHIPMVFHVLFFHELCMKSEGFTMNNWSLGPSNFLEHFPKSTPFLSISMFDTGEYPCFFDSWKAHPKTSHPKTSHPAGIVGSGSSANSSTPTWEDIRDLENDQNDRDFKQGGLGNQYPLVIFNV